MISAAARSRAGRARAENHLKSATMSPQTIGRGRTWVIGLRAERTPPISTPGWSPRFDPGADDSGTGRT